MKQIRNGSKKTKKKTKQKKQYYQKNKERILERQKQRKMEKKTSMIMTFLFEKKYAIVAEIMASLFH